MARVELLYVLVFVVWLLKKLSCQDKLLEEKKLFLSLTKSLYRRVKNRFSLGLNKVLFRKSVNDQNKCFIDGEDYNKFANHVISDADVLENTPPEFKHFLTKSETR